MARVIGNQRVVMHANHGITTVAPTVAEAFTDLFFLESCCEDYHRVVSSGATPRLVANDLAQRTSEEMADMSETDAAPHLRGVEAGPRSRGAGLRALRRSRDSESEHCVMRARAG